MFRSADTPTPGFFLLPTFRFLFPTRCSHHFSTVRLNWASRATPQFKRNIIQIFRSFESLDGESIYYPLSISRGGSRATLKMPELRSRIAKDRINRSAQVVMRRNVFSHPLPIRLRIDRKVCLLPVERKSLSYNGDTNG